MTDYPTRAEIDAAANTLERLQGHIDRSTPYWGVSWSALETVRELLVDPSPALGFPAPSPEPEPEPEPQPTAAEVLKFAYACTESRTPEQGIVYAAKCYAEAHPAWFANWHEYDSPGHALHRAGVNAHSDGDTVASNVLWGASSLAVKHPELFDGAS